MTDNLLGKQSTVLHLDAHEFIKKVNESGNALQLSTFNTCAIRGTFILVALCMKSCISELITVSGAPLITVLVTSLSAERCKFELEVISLDTTIQVQYKHWFEKVSHRLLIQKNKITVELVLT